MVSTSIKIKSDRLISITAVLVLLSLIYFFSDKSGKVFNFSCIHKRIFGFECPLCGGTRAIYEIMHFNLTAAWKLNPAIYSLVLFFLFEVVDTCLNYTYDKYRKLIVWFVITSFVIVYFQRMFLAFTI